MNDDDAAMVKRFEDAQKAVAPTREFATDEEWWEDYVDRVRRVMKNREPAEHIMALSMEALQHNDMFGYNKAVTEVLKQDTLIRFAKTPKQSLDWGEAMGHLIMEGNTLPWLYHQAHEFDVLKHEDRAEALTWAWTDAEWPEMYMDTDLWLDYFREVGFVEDADLGERPDKPMILWRGATEARMDGMAWTERPEVANWFAKRWTAIEDSEPVKVYRLEVYPEDVVAHFTGRSEAEWLVDPYSILWENVEEFEVDSTEELRRPRRTHADEEVA